MRSGRDIARVPFAGWPINGRKEDVPIRRVLLALRVEVPLFLSLLLLSGMGWGAVGDSPLADVLRGPYGAPMTVVMMPPTADVLRSVYDAPVVMADTPSLADVLRSPYGAPMALAVVPSTADVLRGGYDTAVLAPMASAR